MAIRKAAALYKGSKMTPKSDENNENRGNGKTRYSGGAGYCAQATTRESQKP